MNNYIDDYLESLVENKLKQNVLILLSSGHAIWNGLYDAPTYVADTVGNHYAENWLSAIRENGLTESIIVLAEIDELEEKNQLTLYIDKDIKSREAQILDREGNKAALAAAFK